MDPAERLAKKRREAERFRDVEPGRSLMMGFSMCDFAREVREAADHARL